MRTGFDPESDSRDILSGKSKFYPNGSVKKLVLDAVKIGEHHIFWLNDRRFRNPFVRMEIVESLLRRNVTPNDVSTGLGQFKPSTAADAVNKQDETEYNTKDNKTLDMFWNKLQDDDYNLDMMGKFLKVKTQYAKNSLAQKGEGDREPTPWEIMKAYNGSGDEADRYADAAVQYYEAFLEYNSALEKLGGQR